MRGPSDHELAHESTTVVAVSTKMDYYWVVQLLCSISDRSLIVVVERAEARRDSAWLSFLAK